MYSILMVGPDDMVHYRLHLPEEIDFLVGEGPEEATIWATMSTEEKVEELHNSISPVLNAFLRKAVEEHG